MARLNWENVQAPDFSTSLEALKAGAASFNQALGQGRNLVDTIKADQTDRANKEFALAAAGFTNPEELQAALAKDPTLGVDPRRISTSTINGGLERVNNLLETEKGQIGLKSADLGFRSATADFEVRTRDRARAEEKFQRVKAAGPIIEEFVAAARANDTGKMNELQGKLSGMLEHDELVDVLQGGDGFLDSGRTRTRTAETDAWTNTIRGRETLSFEEGRQADDLSETLREYVAPGDDVDAFLNSKEGKALLSSKGYSPTVIAAARGKINAILGMSGGGAGGASVAGGGSSGSGSGGAPGSAPMDDAKIAVHSTLSSKLPPAVVAGFLGNFRVEGGYGNAQGDGGSASGIAQWRLERRENFKRMFGKDPHQASHADQAKFVLWEMENPGKAGMTVQQRDAILAAKSPEEAAELIDRFYERSDGKHRDRRIAAAREYAGLNPTALRATNADGAIRATQGVVLDNRTRMLAGFHAAAQDVASSPRAVAQKLTAEGGEFAGESAGVVNQAIVRVMDEYGIGNPALAGRILADSINRDKNWWEKSIIGKGWNINIDDRKVAQYAQMARNPQALSDAALKVEGSTRATDKANGAEQVYLQSVADFNRIRDAVASRNVRNPDANPQVQRARRIMNEAEAAARGSSANLIAQANSGAPPSSNRNMPAPVAQPAPPRRVAAPRNQGLIFKQPPVQRPAGNEWQQVLQQYGPLGRGPVR
jgi:hypothetical protein